MPICQEIKRETNEDRTRPKKTYLHELPITEIVKSGIIRLVSGSKFSHKGAAFHTSQIALLVYSEDEDIKEIR